MKFNNKFPSVYPICINLEERKSKKKWMVKQAKRNNMKLNFYTAKLHDNPKRGCKRPMILDGDFKVVPLSQTSFQEMDFIESTKSIETTVLKTLGVPPLLLDAGNNANINPNLRMFYINTVMPLINKITMGFETFFGYDIKPVTQDVLALRPDLRELGAFHTSLVNAGIFTVNESRVDLRREKFKDPKADEMRIPANIAGSAVDPNEGGRPSEENEDE